VMPIDPSSSRVNRKNRFDPEVISLQRAGLDLRRLRRHERLVDEWWHDAGAASATTGNFGDAAL
jgi:hypothetical protein